MSVKKTATAPYNFIPLPDKVLYKYSSDKDLPKHNIFDPKLKTGCIEYTIKTDTATLIGDGSNDGTFFKVNGEYTIPGSTVRGLTRSNVEILSDSYPHLIGDQRFTYREVGSKAQFSTTKEYKRLLSTSINQKINQVVKAGVIFKYQNEFYIKPLNGYVYENNKYNFYRIKNDTIKKLAENRAETGFEVKMSLDNREYRPYIRKVAFKSVHEMKIYDGKEPFPEGARKGYLLNSSAFGFGERKKKSHYLFRAEASVTIGEKKLIKVPKELVSAFNSQLKKNENRANKKGMDVYSAEKASQVVFYKPDYYQLPTTNVINLDLSVDELFELEEDQVKPVFYLQASDKEKSNEYLAAFGFTPQMRLPYKFSIRDGIQLDLNTTKIDYANALFGFIETLDEDSSSYKGRVYFKNAKLSSQNSIPKTMEIRKALISPRPTSFQLYLEQQKGETVDESNLVSYNSEDFRLRGYKHYWLKDGADLSSQEANHAAKMKPIVEPVSFNGTVYFENLSEDELGLLLMALIPFEEGFINIGQGKPYGFGKAKLELNTLKYFSNGRFNGFDISTQEVVLEENSLNVEIDRLKQIYERNYFEMAGFELDDFNNTRFWAFYMSKNYVVSEKDKKDFVYMEELRRFARDREILKSAKEYLDEYSEYSFLTELNEHVRTAENLVNEYKSNDSRKVSASLSTVQTVIVSEKESDESLMRVLLADRPELIFQKRNDFILDQQDVIFFNNFEDVGYVEKFIRADNREDRVYFFLTLHDKRLAPIKGKYIHFSNNVITVKDNLRQAIDFAIALKGGRE